MKVHISPGNIKMGAIPSVSLPPYVTCIPNPPCRQTCYARGVYIRPNVGMCWDRNYTILKKSMPRYFELIREWVELHKPRMFRWHVGGDIPSRKYIVHMCQLAIKYSHTRFIAFTKRHKWLTDADHVDNLVLNASMWPEWGEPDKIPPHIRRFWAVNKWETRVPDDAVECSGFCLECGLCWDSTGARDVREDMRGVCKDNRWKGVHCG